MTPDLVTMRAMFGAMIGHHAFLLPALVTDELNPYLVTKLAASAGLPGLPLEMLVLALLLVIFSPDANEIVRRIEQHPRVIYAILLAVLFVVSVLHLTQETIFLYFQF